ncbi:RHS repeat-associated core domain-containing protein, partial [Paucibacter sp. APW11]
NGRLFDPRLGVFLQADPMLQDPFNLQNYNRYGYCYNNPMGCTDPSGYFFGIDDALFVFLAVTSAYVAHEVPELRPFIGLAWSIALGGAGGPFTGFTGAGVANAATAGFISGAIASGGSLQGGLQGAFSAGMFNMAGNLISGGDFLSAGGKGAVEWSTPASVALHGVVGCVTSMAGGGECGAGALSAAFSKAVSSTSYMKGLSARAGTDLSAKVEGTIISAVVGGTGAVLGGGRFSNGAVTGAFGYLFNELLHQHDGTKQGRRLAHQRAGYEEYTYADGTVCNGAGDASCHVPPQSRSGEYSYGRNQCVTAECAAGVRPAPSENRTQGQIDVSLCETTCGWLGPGGPLPTGLGRKLLEWAGKSAGTQVGCKAICAPPKKEGS